MRPQRGNCVVRKINARDLLLGSHCRLQYSFCSWCCCSSALVVCQVFVLFSCLPFCLACLLGSCLCVACFAFLPRLCVWILFCCYLVLPFCFARVLRFRVFVVFVCILASLMCLDFALFVTALSFLLRLCTWNLPAGCLRCLFASLVCFDVVFCGRVFVVCFVCA